MPVRALALLLPLLAATPALAHGGHAEGFGAGLAHPMLGLDHLVAMLATGFWAAQRRMPWLPLAFLAGMAGGIALGFGAAMPGLLEHGVAGTLVLVGLAVALAVRLPAMACVGAAALFGALHGAAHGGEVAGSLVLTAAGMLAGSALLQGLGFAAGRVATQRLARAGGAAVAMVGVVLILA